MLRAGGGDVSRRSRKRDRLVGAGLDSNGLTRRPIGGRGSRALVGRIDVEDLDPACRPVVDEEIVGGAELDECRSWAGWLSGELLLLHRVVGGRSR